MIYMRKDLYIIEYVNNELSISFSTSNRLYEDEKYKFMHNFKTDLSSSGSPIISNNNKIIGIQSNKLTINGRNNGIVLSFPIKEFIQFYYNKDKKELINNNINNIINNNIINDNIINDKPIDELDSKENINIKINKLNILDLSNKCIENNELSELSQSEYYNLKELDLAHNKISDIKELEKLKLQNLEKLNLNHNKLLNLNW